MDKNITAMFTTIKNICSTDNKEKLVVKGRVKTKSSLISYNSTKGNGKRFSADIFDNFGVIRVVAFHEEAENNFKHFEENKVVIITNPVVVIANKMYNKTNHNYELKLNKSSIVESFDFDENHIELRSACTSLSELNGVITGTVVDVIGICTNVKEVEYKSSPSKGETYTLREISITDKTLAEVNITMWGEMAQTFSANIGDVLYIINTKTVDFMGGKKLSMGSNSRVEVNPNWETEMKKWYHDTESHCNEINNISQPLFTSQDSIKGVQIKANNTFYEKVLELNQHNEMELKEKLSQLDKTEEDLKKKREEVNFSLKRIYLERELIIKEKRKC